MNKQLIATMHCPYCGSNFRIARECRQHEGRLVYGIVECNCFRFPVVDGILLLNLAKGYGGAEEVLQPYVPLQIAALQYLDRDDISGLLGWMRRHMPLAAELIEGTSSPYLALATRLDLAADREAQRFLDENGRYEVLGNRGRLAPLRRFFARRGSADVPRTVTDQQVTDKLPTYYISRFFSPRVNALALQLGALPLNGKILSLCCGHGVFENLLAADGRAKEVVCVDGQFLNLLITRRYSSQRASFICHDVQFPLPFADGSFDGVFSSTCLPEIPAQRTFVTEAIRVTANTGWTLFDSIWNTEMGVKRISPYRHYRFCQNFFSRLEDYIPLFEKCAGAEREVGVYSLGKSDISIDAAAWSFGADRAKTLAQRTDHQISVLIQGRAHPVKFSIPVRPWLTADHLSVTPVYAVEKRGTELKLQRLRQFAQLIPAYAASAFAGYPETGTIQLELRSNANWLLDQFRSGTLALLPQEFDSSERGLSALA